ncbi:MAG: hypothetical protein KY444_09165 [Gemmatimonadetes bacterium]|nr:hypothetical protein [Gemmatimonadota bacterium]
MAILNARAAVLALSLFLLAGCERAADPLSYAEESRGVYGLVVAGSGDVRVLVTQLDPAAGQTRGLAGADVRMWRGADTVRLTPGGAPGVPCFDGAEGSVDGCYSARLTRPPAPGEHWALRVRFPGGAVATGMAVVPSPPAIQSPAQGARVGVANRGVPVSGPAGSGWLAEIDVSYVPDPLTREFDVLLSPGVGYAGGAVLSAARCGPPERRASAGTPFSAPTRVLLRISRLGCTAEGAAVAWDSIAATVDVVAYDTAYSRYLRQVHHADAVRSELASAGITGAYGAFGAAARAARPAMLVAEP